MLSSCCPARAASCSSPPPGTTGTTRLWDLDFNAAHPTAVLEPVREPPARAGVSLAVDIVDPTGGMRDKPARLRQLLIRTAADAGLVLGTPTPAGDGYLMSVAGREFGHTYGDEVLREVAHRLAVALREREWLVRLGADEFAVLITGLPERDTAVRRAANLLATLTKQPIRIGRRRLSLGARAGVAVDVLDIAELLRRAGVALLAAKRNAQAVELYRPELDTGSGAPASSPR
jgi:hypothetical protein